MCTSACRTGTPPGSRKSICWCCTACATASISSCSARSDEGPDLAGACRRGGRTSDSLITAQVKARYLRAKAFNPVHVKVVTEAGVVYLMGVVTEREADDAVDLARTTSGVRKVVKIFEYCKAAEQVCRPHPPGPPEEKPKPAA